MLAISTMALFSCVKNPSPVTPDPESDLDLSFTFGTRSDVNMNVTAYNESGQESGGVLFSVYTQNPYTEDGNRNSSLCPIYQGFTNSNGSVGLVIPAPTSSDNLYIIPEYAGYGSMVEVERAATVDVVLSGKESPEAAYTKADEVYSRERTACGNNFKFYTYYIPGTDYDPDYAELTPSDLVSSEVLSDDFKAVVNEWFPDGGSNFDPSICSDLEIEEDGTEIWVTYIGDGGFSITNNLNLNSLFYYTYDEGELPTSMADFPALKNFMKEDHGITYAILDAHPKHIACGTKVQLLYWDGEKYIKEFPAGKRVGFAFVLDGYRPSYSARGFSFKAENSRFSYPGLNPSGNALAVTVWNNEFQCYITGCEYGGSGGEVTHDTDFNDMLLKISSSKHLSVIGTQVTPEEETTSEINYEGTLAFEDIWPYQGDYDFNDFVTDYKYTLVKTSPSNNILSATLTFTPKAVGASGDNGFGIQLPFSKSAVASITGAELNPDENMATITVYDDVRTAFGGMGGCINTETKLAHYTSTPITISITFSTPIPESDISFYGFNPYIFSTENTGKEIHLVDYAPTSNADYSLLGTGVDKSDPEKGIYYRMDNSFPWALDIAKSSIYNWRYPTEMTIITSAYLHYQDWVTDHQTSWFDWTKEGNAELSLLYPDFSELNNE